MPTWVVIGDSIMSDVPGGTASQHALHLLAAEKNIYFKNLSVPMHALGVVGSSGFHNAYMVNELDNLNGYYGAGFAGIIVQAGTNGHGRSISWGDTYNSLVRILTWAQTNGKKVLVLDPIWKETENTLNSLGYNLNQYRFFMAYAVTQYPTCSFFAHRENTIIGTSAGASYFVSLEAPNRTHLTAAGHRKLADWIKAEAATAGYF